jgi:heat shock protein HslJ
VKSTLALLLLAVLLSACGSQPTLPTGQGYVVEWIGEQPLIDRSHLSLTLDEDGRAFGSGGCNHWFASYQLNAEKLTFGPLGSTRKACAPALMQQEQRFFAALANVQRWDFNDIGQLQLWPASGKPLRLWPQDL